MKFMNVMQCNANPKSKKKTIPIERMVTKSIEMKHKNQVRKT